MPLTEEQIDGMAAVFPTEELQLIHDVVTRILEERRRLESIILDERPPGDPRHYEIQNYVRQHIALNPGTTVDRIRVTSNLDRDEVEAAIETLVDERIILLYGGGYYLGVDEVRGETPAAIVIRLAREGQVETFILDHLLAHHVIPTPELRTLARWSVRYAETGGTDWPEPEQALREARGVTFVEAQQQGREARVETFSEIVLRMARAGATQEAILLEVEGGGAPASPVGHEMIRWAVRAQALGLDVWPTPDELFRMAEIRVQATQALQESTVQLNEQLDRATLAEIQLSNGGLTLEALVQRQPPGTNLSNVVMSVQRLIRDGRLRTDIADFLHVSPLNPVDPLTLDTLYAQILTNQGRTAIELAAILNMDRGALVHPLAHLVSSDRIVIRDGRLYTSGSASDDMNVVLASLYQNDGLTAAELERLLDRGPSFLDTPLRSLIQQGTVVERAGRLYVRTSIEEEETLMAQLRLLGGSNFQQLADRLVRTISRLMQQGLIRMDRPENTPPVQWSVWIADPPNPLPLDDEVWRRIVSEPVGLTFNALFDTTVLSEGVLREVVDRLIVQGRVVQHSNGVLQATAENQGTDTSTEMDREVVRQTRAEMERREALAERLLLAQFQFGEDQRSDWVVSAAGHAYLLEQPGSAVDMGAALARLIQRGELLERDGGRLVRLAPRGQAHNRQAPVPNPEPLSALDQLLGDDD